MRGAAPIFAKRTNWDLRSNRLAQALDSLKRKGVPILDLTESNPTRCGFQYYSDEIARALSNPKNLAYEPSPKGLLEARLAVSDYYKEKGVKVDPERIFLTASTSEAYSFLFRLLLNPGGRILVPRPSYPLFDFLAGLNDVEVGTYPVSYDGAWRNRVHRHCEESRLAGGTTKQSPSSEIASASLGSSPRNDGVKGVKALILVHPNNPTGNFVKRGELEVLNRSARERDFAIISDEVFSDYAYAPDVERVPALAGNREALTFTLSGISKMLALPQMKLGWIVVSGTEELAESAAARLEVICDTFLSVNTPVQRALPEWLQLRPQIQTEILKRVSENRAYLEHQMCRAGFQPEADPSSSVAENLPYKGEGGWYAVLKLPNVKSEEEWALEFLERDHVYVHPGYFFDFPEEAYAVLSLLPPPEVFQAGVKTLRG